jgi:thioester reductase-like protein
MNDFERRIAGMSPAKRELLIFALKAKRRLGHNFAALAGSERAMSVETLLAEAVLPLQIDPSIAQPPVGGKPHAIFLTGATGFLGAFLLDALLAETSAQIYCLVRAGDTTEARQRLRANLGTYFLTLNDERIVPVLGDLTLPGLGLTSKIFDQLSHEIDLIYHCGAAVKWTYPYRSLSATNVNGTKEILRLACTIRIKPVHFVSTVGVFSSPDYRAETVLETEALERSGPIYVGYAQTKWVAEKLVWLAGERGLPISIYRPNTAPHSITGAFNRNDHLSQMICGCIQLIAAPQLALKVEGAPVDFVAHAIANLSQRSDSQGKAFHLVNSVGVEWLEIVEWLRLCGYTVDMISYESWYERLLAAIRGPQVNMLLSLSPFFSEAILKKVRLPVFDTRNTEDGLRDSGITCSPLRFDQFERTIDYFIRTGYLGVPGSR